MNESTSNGMGLARSLRLIYELTLRELGALFDARIAVVYTVAFGLLANSIFMNEFFLGGHVSMDGFFERMPYLLAVFLPAIAMRLWAEERRTRTLELLLTLPLHPLQAVLGKFAAALSLFELYLCTSLPIPVLLVVLGEPDLGQIACAYLGLWLFGALLLSLGGLLSALSPDQITAFVVSAIVSGLAILLGLPGVAAVLDGLAPELAPGSFLRGVVSPLPPYEALTGGLVELSSLVYFAGLSALFLWATALVLRHRRA